MLNLTNVIRRRPLMAAREDITARRKELKHGDDRTASVIELLVHDVNRLTREVKEMASITV